MASNDKKPEYKGPGTVASALGYANLDSAIGAATGAVVGGLAGNLTAPKKATAAMEDFGSHVVINGKNAAKLSSLDMAATAISEATHGNIGVRAAKTGLGAAIGIAALAAVGTIVGVVRGVKKAKAGKEQFDELTNHNTALEQKLQDSNQRLDDVKSFVAKIDAERAKALSQGAARA